MDLNRSAVDILADLHDRSLSAETLLQATFERIDAFNPTVNAIVGLADRENVLAQAGHWTPALCAAARPAACAQGSGQRCRTAFYPWVADLCRSGPRHRRRAGRQPARGRAILIGKTNVPEFGLGSHTFNLVYGRTTNPYDPARTCVVHRAGRGCAGAGHARTRRRFGHDGVAAQPAAWNNVWLSPDLGAGGARAERRRCPASDGHDVDRWRGRHRIWHCCSTCFPAGSPARRDGAPRPLLPGLQAFAAAGTDLSGMRIGWLGIGAEPSPASPGSSRSVRCAGRPARAGGGGRRPAHARFDDLWRSGPRCDPGRSGRGSALRQHADLMKDSAVGDGTRRADERHRRARGQRRGAAGRGRPMPCSSGTTRWCCRRRRSGPSRSIWPGPRRSTA